MASMWDFLFGKGPLAQAAGNSQAAGTPPNTSDPSTDPSALMKIVASQMAQQQMQQQQKQQGQQGAQKAQQNQFQKGLLTGIQQMLAQHPAAQGVPLPAALSPGGQQPSSGGLMALFQSLMGK